MTIRLQLKRATTALAISIAAACTPVIAGGRDPAQNDGGCASFGYHMEGRFCVVEGDLGGVMADYTHRAERLTAAGVPVRFRGFNASGPMLFIAVPGSCIERGGAIGFHGAQDLDGYHDMLGSFGVARYFRGALRAWYEGDVTRGSGPMWLYGEDFETRTAQELREMNAIEVC